MATPLNGVSKWIKEPGLLKRFVVWPAAVGPALAAFPIVAAYSRDLQVPYWGYWARWFTGDMIGIVLWLPLGIILMGGETYALFAWKRLPGTVSIGCWSFVSMLGALPESLIDAADQDLYSAKLNGRNRVSTMVEQASAQAS